MGFSPFDMFGGDGHPFPFPQSRAQNQRSFPNSQTPQPVHENSSRAWPFEVPGHGSRNGPKPNANANANCRRGSTAPPSKPTTSRKGRVVPIPVYDAGTESPSVSTKAAKVAAPRMDQGVAAVKIQSAFRGFCVRNSKPLENLRIIGRVKSEADEMGRRLATQTQSIRGNEYECLKLDNQIMSLLLRLDALQGVKSFVRESRKDVYRLVFRLQEALDAITAEKSMSVEGAGQSDHEHIPERDPHSHANPNSGTPELSGMEPEKEGVTKISEEEYKCTIGAADCEEQQQQHIGGENIQCDGIWKGRAAVDKMENQTLEVKVVLADLYRKLESSDKLISDLSFRVAQLERQICEDEDNDKEK